MPAPMVPPPTTPMAERGRGVAFASGIFATARSAKKAWTMASRCGSAWDLSETSVSRLSPSASGRVQASTASTQ